MLLIRLLGYYKKNSQMEETHRASYQERAGVPCPPREDLRSPCIHPLEVLWTLVWGFMEAAVCKHDGWLDHWPLVTELHLQPLSSPGRSRGWDHPSNHRAGFTGYQPPSLVNQEVFQTHFIKHNKSHHFTLSPRNSKGFRSFVSGKEWKTKSLLL